LVEKREISLPNLPFLRHYLWKWGEEEVERAIRTPVISATQRGNRLSSPVGPQEEDLVVGGFQANYLRMEVTTKKVKSFLKIWKEPRKNIM
jgi:hypothetical protein